jgi:hypothetical protein
MQAKKIILTVIQYTRCNAYFLNSAVMSQSVSILLGGGIADFQSLQKQILPSTNKAAVEGLAEQGRMIPTSNARRKPK